jgi:hypothetical protein
MKISHKISEILDRIKVSIDEFFLENEHIRSIKRSSTSEEKTQEIEKKLRRIHHKLIERGYNLIDTNLTKIEAQILSNKCKEYEHIKKVPCGILNFLEISGKGEITYEGPHPYEGLTYYQNGVCGFLEVTEIINPDRRKAYRLYAKKKS